MLDQSQKCVNARLDPLIALYLPETESVAAIFRNRVYHACVYPFR
jgi:hypothetical protein